MSVCSAPTPPISALSSLQNSPCHSAVTSPEVRRRQHALTSQRKLRARQDLDLLCHGVKQVSLGNGDVSPQAPPSPCVNRKDVGDVAAGQRQKRTIKVSTYCLCVPIVLPSSRYSSNSSVLSAAAAHERNRKLFYLNHINLPLDK